MKYLFILLFTLLINLTVKSQTIYHNSVVMNVYNYNTWLQGEDTGLGYGSFGIMTYTTGYKNNDGYYYYDIYLLTNSYYESGILCSSYIEGIKIYAMEYGKWVNVINFDYILVPPKGGTFDGFFHLSYIYNINKIQKIKVTWDEVTAY